MVKPEVTGTWGSLGTDREEGFDPYKNGYFQSFLVLCGSAALWSFKVLPVRLALAALDSAEELLDESSGFCFNCGHRGKQFNLRPFKTFLRPFP